MANQMTAVNTRPAGQVVALPSVGKEIFYQTYSKTLFGILSYTGKNTDTVSLYAGKNNAGNAAIKRINIASGLHGMNAEVRKITGKASFGDKAPVATNPLEFGNVEYATNKITSPEVPLRGDMSVKELEPFIEDSNSEVRKALTNWFVSYLDYAMAQSFLNGASVNLLASRMRGGLNFQFTGRSIAGIPQMNRNVWIADVNNDTMFDLDWETVHSTWGDLLWNGATQSAIEILAADTGAGGYLSRNKLDKIGLMAANKKFAQATTIDATTNFLFIVSPEEVVALRRSIDDKVQIDVGTLLNQLAFYGFKEGFLYNGILVIDHPILKACSPKVNGGTSLPTGFTAPVFGGGMDCEDWTSYVLAQSDAVGVGFLHGRESILQTDNANIKHDIGTDKYGKAICVKQETMFGAVRKEFPLVSINDQAVDMRISLSKTLCQILDR
ncbi:MAG: hypothetical protein FWE23_08770 [Chitinivibrionia bacterium]|nr:hypothetical protein [Chitinivibrionia bacterium]